MQVDFKAGMYVNLAYENIKITNTVKRQFDNIFAPPRKFDGIGEAVIFGDPVPRYRDPRLFQHLPEGFQTPIPCIQMKRNSSRPQTTPGSMGSGAGDRLSQSLSSSSNYPSRGGVGLGGLGSTASTGGFLPPRTPPSQTGIYPPAPSQTGPNAAARRAFTSGHGTRTATFRRSRTRSGSRFWDDMPWPTQVENWRAGEAIEFPPPGMESCKCKLDVRFHEPAPLPPAHLFFP